jgi:hypothetical protein
MTVLRKISLQEFKNLHRANGGFHDAELLQIEIVEDRKSIRILLADLRRFGEDGLPEPAAREIELLFEGIVVLSSLNPTSMVKYGVNQFGISENESIYIETVMASVKFSFTSIAVFVFN